jgi:hypothetical protein
MKSFRVLDPSSAPLLEVEIAKAWDGERLRFDDKAPTFWNRHLPLKLPRRVVI